jgi:hypothetical protein
VTDESTSNDLSDEELAEQRAEELPDRQAMTVMTIGPERPIPLDGIPETNPPGLE